MIAVEKRKEGVYLSRAMPALGDDSPVVIERVNGDATVDKLIIAKSEAVQLVKDLAEFLGEVKK